MISTDQFAHGDPTEIYRQMRPDQWTAIANEFVRVLKIAGDSQADRFAGVAATDSQQTTTSTPVLKTLDQAIAVHRHTRDHYPDLFAEVARHPVTVASLRTPGTPAEAEVAEAKDGAYERAASLNSAVDMDTFTPEASARTPGMGYPEATAGGLQPPHEGGSPPERGQPGILREPRNGGSEDDTW
ncbi:MAG TPA: hypothetical protein VF510_25190 [Ktedonobacterales bacterium]